VYIQSNSINYVKKMEDSISIMVHGYIKHFLDISRNTLKSLLLIYFGFGIKWEIEAMIETNVVKGIMIGATLFLILFVLAVVEKINDKNKKEHGGRVY